MKCLCVAGEGKKQWTNRGGNEALMGVNIGLLTIYDMVKAIDKRMVISEVCLLEKQGGKSGHFVR